MLAGRENHMAEDGLHVVGKARKILILLPSPTCYDADCFKTRSMCLSGSVWALRKYDQEVEDVIVAPEFHPHPLGLFGV